MESGQAQVQRSEVPFTEVTNPTFFTALDIDNQVQGPEYSGLYDPGAPAWFVPFGNGGLTVECYANPCPDAGCGARIRMGISQQFHAGVSFKASSVSF